MVTITRKFEFDYGHRVLGHEGKCRFLHGHRGVLELTVTAPDLDNLGRVIDFGQIKLLVQTWLDDNWDHNLLLNADDPQLNHLRVTEPRKPYVMLFGNPTAENMVKEMWVKIPPLFQGTDIRVQKIRIWETPNCYAESDEEDAKERRMEVRN